MGFNSTFRQSAPHYHEELEPDVVVFRAAQYAQRRGGCAVYRRQVLVAQAQEAERGRQLGPEG
jgi:hypothetical protein